MGLLIPLLGMLTVLAIARAIGERTDRVVRNRLLSLSAGRGSGGISTRGILEAVGRSRVGRLSGEKEAERLARRIELAGSDWSPQAVLGASLCLAVGSASLVTWLAPSLASGLALASLISVAAFRFPGTVLARMGRSRQTRMEFHVPDLVELLLATTEAGLAPAVSLRRSGEVLGGPLGEELRRAVAEIDLGLPWRVAMNRMVERTSVASLRRLVGALARSSRLGAPVRATLRSVADELRADRRSRAEEMARRAPVKMLFPLVFLRG